MKIEIKKWAIFGAALAVVSLAIGFILYTLMGQQLGTTPVSGLATAAISLIALPFAIIFGAIYWVILGNTIYAWLFKKYPLVLGLWGAGSVATVLLALLGPISVQGLAVSIVLGGVYIYITVWVLKHLKVKW